MGDKIRPCCKVGQPWVIINTSNLVIVELRSSMLLAKFQDHHTSDSDVDFKMFLPNKGHGHLGHVTAIYINFSLPVEAPHEI